MRLFEPIERIGIHRTALVFLEYFGWIEREQPISDFGIDMHVEIVEDGIPTGQIFALQIKSGSSYFREETSNGFIYRGDNRHLEYWLSQSVPVLIIIYEPESKNIFWEQVISSKVSKTESAWKIEIPRSNLLINSEADLLKVYHNPNHYTVMNVSDISHAGARRIEGRILVEGTYARSRIAMKKMIPEIIKKFKSSDYHRNKITKQQYLNKDADIVSIFFYDSIQQVERGLTFCRAIWNNKECKYPLSPFDPDEIVNDVEIKWDIEYPDINKFINENQLSKGDYLEKANTAFSHVKLLYEEISEVYDSYKEKGNYKKLIDFIKMKERGFNLLIENPLQEGLPPLECQDLDQLIQEAQALIHNIWIVVSDKNRDEQNISFLIKDYLKMANNKIQYFDYELKKVR